MTLNFGDFVVEKVFISSLKKKFNLLRDDTKLQTDGRTNLLLDFFLLGKEHQRSFVTMYVDLRQMCSGDH
jgi:hypothetical protein